MSEEKIEKCIVCRVSEEDEEIVYDENSIPYCMDCFIEKEME